jgi:hypothetical protein
MGWDERSKRIEDQIDSMGTEFSGVQISSIWTDSGWVICSVSGKRIG